MEGANKTPSTALECGQLGHVRTSSPERRAFAPAKATCIRSTKRRLFEGAQAEEAQQPDPPQPDAAASPPAASAARMGNGGAAGSSLAAAVRRATSRMLFQPAPSTEQLEHTFADFQQEV